MTRREFRVSLDSPRPLAAVILAGVASATLMATGQLAPWAMALQALLLLQAVVFRTRPFVWQRSPWALNVLLGGAVAVAFVLAWQGAGALVSLAHFALLAQGLQLLDARPRRSEFLLVALALFQVVLASNLTDSLLFAPLLALFLPTAVWTLIVHTLRSEAIEAGTPAAADRVLTPALLRTTVVASLLSLVLALFLFLLFPRLPAHLVRGPLHDPSEAVAGFSDRVELGDLGRIRGDRSVVLRVETLRGAPPPREHAYWRGLAFDHFDGRSWSLESPGRRLVPGDPELGVELAPASRSSDLVQRLVREPLDSGVLFAVSSPLVLEGDLGRVERDRNGGLYSARSVGDRVRYTVSSQTRLPSDDELRRDVAELPRDGGRYLELPPFSDAVRRLALEAVGPARDDADRARAIEHYLRRTGRYTDTPPHLDPKDPRSPIEAFLLGERAGHCEYFASAMVVLARMVGLPARLVNGLAGGHENAIGGFVELTQSDAHAWVEIHYRRAGWVRYDPTPPDLRLRAEAGLGFGDRLEELRSAFELWWFQRVVNFDRADQARTLRAAWNAWHRTPLAGAGRRGQGHGLPALRALLRPLAFGALAVGLLAFLGWAAWRRRPHAALPRDYARALRLLARRGLEREAALPARDFARRAAASLPEPAARAFAALTERYLAERFGGEAAAPGGAELRLLRDSLRA